MDLWSSKERIAARARAQKRPGGAFLGAGHGLFELLFLLHQEQHLMGCCSFFLHGFYGAKKRILEQVGFAPRNAPVGRF